MPEHAHLLILPHEGSVVRRILWHLKRPVTYRAIQWVRAGSPAFLQRMAQTEKGRTQYHFWQAGGGYDRNLWSVKDIHEKVKYIHENPVRRGLVASPGDWEWSSHRAWESDTDEPIRIDKDTLPPLVS